MSLIPGAWYAFITTAFICTEAIGFNLPYPIAMGIGVATAAIYSVLVWKHGLKLRESKAELEAVPVY